VGQNNCELTEDGRKARDELLALLYPNGSYTDTLLHQHTGVDRGQTIPKILGKIPAAIRKKPSGIQQGKLEQFFEHLLRRLEGPSENNQTACYLQKYKLIEPYKRLWQAHEDFYLPKKLYKISVDDNTTGIQTNKSNKRGHENKLLNTNIIDLLWQLDYKQQERAFDDALEEQSKCAAFSIVAPCETTQRWILNRLRKKISLRESALILPPIGLKQHPMRHKFEHFWEDLADRFGTKPEPEAVLKGICHTEVNRPLILTVYEFRQFETVQRRILNEFWEPLTQMIAESPRTERSRVVLFLVDQGCPTDDTEKVLKLAPLEKIPQKDVRSWLNSPQIEQWWQPKFGDDFGDRVMEEVLAENCQAPYAILDKMCFKFGVKGGIVDVEEAWKWAS
jgi:inactive STAND